VIDQGRLVGGFARARVPLGFACGALVFWLASPTPGSVAAGSVVAGAGEALRIWAAGHLNKGREVTASGPYRWTAHPLYMGSALMALGLVVASNRVSVALLVGAYMIVTITAATRNEEAFLRSRFGGEYERYRREGVVNDRRFSFGLVMANREYRAVGGLMLALLLLGWKATYNERFRGQSERNPSGRAVSSVVEHRLYTPAVTGSSPVPPTIPDPPFSWLVRRHSRVRIGRSSSPLSRARTACPFADRSLSNCLSL
jgi:hypothetical protein